MLSQMWNIPKSKAAFVRSKDSVNCLGNIHHDKYQIRN